MYFLIFDLFSETIYRFYVAVDLNGY